MEKKERYKEIIDDIQNLLDYEKIILFCILDNEPCTKEQIYSKTMGFFRITKNDYNSAIEHLVRKKLIKEDKKDLYNSNPEVIGAFGYIIDCKNGID